MPKYNLYRLPFVLAGARLFRVFPRFGELLLGANDPRWLVHALGWTYHFSNGAALGIMFLALVWSVQPRVLFWGAVGWRCSSRSGCCSRPKRRFSVCT